MLEPEHVRVNREAWTRNNAEYNDVTAAQAWADPEVTWGLFAAPERDLRMLPDVVGKEIIELGCGTGYFGARLKRLGARRVVGVDITPAQLDTARRLNREHGLGLEFIEANAESVPLPDGVFDVAVSEYGACLYCEPDLWIAEAARLLRPGGELIFLRNSTLSLLCMPATGPVQDRLQRPQLGLNRIVWDDDEPGIEFHPGTSDLLRCLQRSGFELVDFAELFAHSGTRDHPRYSHIPADWAMRWPVEEIWRARKLPT